MRAKRVLFGCLIVAALAVTATPMTAAVGPKICKPVYASFETTWIPDKSLEVGWVTGTFDGAVYLIYDDTAPPIDPEWNRPNLVLSDKNGELRLWVHSESIPDKEGWHRVFKVLRHEATGAYAGLQLDLWSYGYFTTGKSGVYELEGKICQPSITPRRRR
jgi:hypothetical protein